MKHIPNVRSIKFIIQPPYTPLRDEANRTLTVEDIFSRYDVIRYQIIIFCQKTLQKVKGAGVTKSGRSEYANKITVPRILLGGKLLIISLSQRSLWAKIYCFCWQMQGRRENGSSFSPQTHFPIQY